MHQVSSDPLFLTDIISIDENKADKNYFSGSGNLHTLIRNIIRDIISKELKFWLEKNLSATIGPILRDYLLNSRKKISGETNFLNGFPFHKPDLSTKMVPLVDFVYGLKVFNDIYLYSSSKVYALTFF